MRPGHRYAAGAAACAACCAAPVLTLPLFAGLGASVAAFLCSGPFLAVVVATVVSLLVWRRRFSGRQHASTCTPTGGPVGGPVDIELSTAPPAPGE